MILRILFDLFIGLAVLYFAYRLGYSSAKRDFYTNLRKYFLSAYPDGGTVQSSRLVNDLLRFIARPFNDPPFFINQEIANKSGIEVIKGDTGQEEKRVLH